MWNTHILIKRKWVFTNHVSSKDLPMPWFVYSLQFLFFNQHLLSPPSKGSTSSIIIAGLHTLVNISMRINVTKFSISMTTVILILLRVSILYCKWNVDSFIKTGFTVGWSLETIHAGSYHSQLMDIFPFHRNYTRQSQEAVTLKALWIMLLFTKPLSPVHNQ